MNEPGSREKKVKTLLEIIERRSHAQYEKFVDCLRTSHEHVARAIVNPGGMQKRVSRFQNNIYIIYDIIVEGRKYPRCVGLYFSTISKIYTRYS